MPELKKPCWNSQRTLNFYGYYGPTDGTWIENGEKKSCGTDFRTVEKFREYKDAGLTILMLGGVPANMYNGEDWETSDIKMIMDRAYEAGIDKILVHDARIRPLGAVVGGIVGEGKPFATEEELDKTVAAYMAPYRDHPAFYGVLLHDEPKYTMMRSIGQIYRSVKRVCAKAFPHCNLWPPAFSAIGSFLPPPAEGENKTIENSWKAYLKMFIDETGADYVQYDHYPMQPDLFAAGYIKGLQMTAEFARDNNVKFYHVAQAFAMIIDGKLQNRYIKEPDAYYLANLMLGFGVAEVAYYTYWAYPNNLTKNVIMPQDSSFINFKGEKNELYGIMQKAIAYMKGMYSVTGNFEYCASTYIVGDRKDFCNDNVADYEFYGLNRDKLRLATDAVVDRDTVLITEMQDKKSGHILYTVQNIIDPYEAVGKDADENITICFGGFRRAVAYKDGKEKDVKLEDGRYSLTLSPGQAEFIIPYDKA